MTHSVWEGPHTTGARLLGLFVPSPDLQGLCVDTWFFTLLAKQSAHSLGLYGVSSES